MDMYDKILKLLDEKGITKKDLSKRTGIPYSSIVSAFSRRSNSFSVSHIQNIAAALNIPISEILNDEQLESKRLDFAYRGLLSLLESLYDTVDIDWNKTVDSDGVPEYDGDYTVLLAKKGHDEITLDKKDFEALFLLVGQNIPAYIKLIKDRD